MTKTILDLGWSSYDFRSHPLFLAILTANIITHSLTLFSNYQINWKMNVEQQEAATRFWSAVFAWKEPGTPYFYRRTKGPIMQYLWIWLESFSKTDATFLSVDKIAVLIALQTLYKNNLPVSWSF